jgi:hypothetical protein
MDGIVSGTGIRAQGDAKYSATLPEPNGRHLWVFLGMWQVANPAASHQNFDMENLLTVEGPGCFWCEQKWVPTIGSKCPGTPEPEPRGQS